MSSRSLRQPLLGLNREKLPPSIEEASESKDSLDAATLTASRPPYAQTLQLPAAARKLGMLDEEGCAHGKKKGSFSGVLVPTCENMWGVLIFLRFFIIVGQAGVVQALLIVLVSFSVAFCTASCLSAIANSGGFISEGGPYYMISRSLGAYVGASIGLMYCLGITLLAVMETVGAVDVVFMLLPPDTVPAELKNVSLLGSSIVVLFLQAASVFVGGIHAVSKLAVGFLVVVLCTVGAYLVCLLFNIQGLGQLEDNLWPNYTGGSSFGSMLSVFFPCFTGILSGANRADVLMDPPKNIREGTFGAITLSLAIYAIFMLLWGMAAPSADLKSEEILQHLSGRAYPFIMVGVFIASISQSLQCLVVSPRLMQQISSDNLIPILKPLSKLSPEGEPQRALLFILVPATVSLVALGSSLDSIAPMLTVCFLLCYASMNLSCLVHTILEAPAWRPQGSRSWFMVVASSGLILSVGVMLTVNVLFACFVMVLAGLLYCYIDYLGARVEWGSGLDGIRLHLALSTLLSRGSQQDRKVNWRPQMLIVYPMGSTLRGNLLKLFNQLRGGSGLCVLAALGEGSSLRPGDRNNVQAEEVAMKADMEAHGICGFHKVSLGRSLSDAAGSCVSLVGLGGLQPNSVMIPWPAEPEDLDSCVWFVRTLEQCTVHDKAVIAVKGFSQGEFPCRGSFSPPPGEDKQCLDIWWVIHDGGLLLLTAWLLSQKEVWNYAVCKVRVFVVAEDVTEEEAQIAAENLENMLRKKNLLYDCEVEIVIMDDDSIEPFTYDWTLRLGQNFYGGDKKIPYSVDDLFRSVSMAHEGERKNQKDSGGRRASLAGPMEGRHSVLDFTNAKSMAELSPKGMKEGLGKLSGVSKFLKEKRRELDRQLNMPLMEGDESEESPPLAPMTIPSAVAPHEFTSPPCLHDEGLERKISRIQAHNNSVLGLGRSNSQIHPPPVASPLPPRAHTRVEKLAHPVHLAPPCSRPSLAGQGGGHHHLLTAASSPEIVVRLSPKFADCDEETLVNMESFEPPAPSFAEHFNRDGLLSQAVSVKDRGEPEDKFQRLNQIMRAKSSGSSLVLLNLPSVWGSKSAEECLSYVSYAECLTEGLQRVLLVQGAKDSDTLSFE